MLSVIYLLVDLVHRTKINDPKYRCQPPFLLSALHPLPLLVSVLSPVLFQCMHGLMSVYYTLQTILLILTDPPQLLDLELQRLPGTFPTYLL